MLVDTKPFGETEVSERQQLVFPLGLFGFEELTRYVLLDAAQPPFYWLQSTERTQVAFVLLDPRLFLPGYRLEVDQEDLKEIGIEEPGDALDFCIVTIPEDPSLMTANLQGPVVVNRRTRSGRQCIAHDPEAPVRHRIMDTLAAKTG